MRPAYGVVVGDGSAGGHHGVGRRLLDFGVGRQLAADFAQTLKGVVRRRPVGIHVGEPAGNAPAATRALQGVVQGRAHHFVHRRPAFPRDRCFQRFGDDAEADGGVALVGCVDERVAPTAHRALPSGGCPDALGGVGDYDGRLVNGTSGVPGNGDGLPDVLALGQFGGFKADYQQRLLAVQPGEILGLGGVKHPQVGRPLLGLGD